METLSIPFEHKQNDVFSLDSYYLLPKQFRTDSNLTLSRSPLQLGFQNVQAILDSVANEDAQNPEILPSFGETVSKANQEFAIEVSPNGISFSLGNSQRILKFFLNWEHKLENSNVVIFPKEHPEEWKQVQGYLYIRRNTWSQYFVLENGTKRLFFQKKPDTYPTLSYHLTILDGKF